MRDVHLRGVVSSKTNLSDDLPANCEVFPTWRGAINADKVDGMIIATPPATHAEIALAAISKGIGVLVEKPMCLSVKNAEKILSEAKKHKGLVMVNHIDLYNPAWIALKDHMSDLGSIRSVESIIGEPECLRANADIPGHWEYGTHFIACCVDLFGGPPDDVTARAVSPDNLGMTPNGHLQDIVEISMSFGGVPVRLVAGTGMDQKYRKVVVSGSEAQLKYDDYGEVRAVLLRDQGVVEIPYSDISPLQNCLRQFIRLVSGHVSQFNDSILARDVVSVLYKCDEQMSGL